MSDQARSPYPLESGTSQIGAPSLDRRTSARSSSSSDRRRAPSTPSGAACREEARDVQVLLLALAARRVRRRPGRRRTDSRAPGLLLRRTCTSSTARASFATARRVSASVVPVGGVPRPGLASDDDDAPAPAAVRRLQPARPALPGAASRRRASVCASATGHRVKKVSKTARGDAGGRRLLDRVDLDVRQVAGRAPDRGRQPALRAAGVLHDPALTGGRDRHAGGLNTPRAPR